MGHAEDFTKFAPNLGLPDTAPVARYVALARWREAILQYERAEHADMSGLTEAEKDAAFDLAGDSIDVVAFTPSPDFTILAEKMRLMHKLGLVLANGYFESLVRDVETLAARAALRPTKEDVVGVIKRLYRKVEPWYGWYQANVFRIDSHCRDFTDESTGNVFRFELQWLGIHVGFEIGRTPRKRTPTEVADARSHLAAMTAAVRAEV